LDYRVRFTKRARRDLFLLGQQINVAESEAAQKWYWGLREAIRKLRRQPNRCPITPEDGSLRHLLNGRKTNIYRVIYRVLEGEKQVEVLHIRHGARGRFRLSDIR
jgi:toxin ParE1/3/4